MGAGGAGRDTLDAENFRGLKMAILVSNGQLPIFGLISEKTGSIFAVYGPISPGRRVNYGSDRAIRKPMLLRR